MTAIYDVAVVGLGAVGSATHYQLSAAGAKVIGFDRYAPPHALGSTHGESRITRLGIGEGVHYSPFAIRSHAIWRELEAGLGLTGDDRLLHERGCLVLGPSDGQSVMHHKADFIATTVAAARENGISHELLDGAEVRRRFPQFAASDNEAGYYEPGGGWVSPENAVTAHLRLTSGEVRTNTRVLSLNQETGHVRVVTDDGEFIAGKVVVSAGAFAPRLLGEPYRDLLRPTRQLLHWFETDGTLDTAWRNGPVFIWAHTASDSFYGFPSILGATVKVADEDHTADVEVEQINRDVSAAVSDQMFSRHLSIRLRGVSRRRARVATCIYTETASGEFLVDWHPDFDRIFVASPCSGHGFKHSAAIGEAIAEQVMQGHSGLSIAPFSYALRQRELASAH
jgi:sarcosine oxidase